MKKIHLFRIAIFIGIIAIPVINMNFKSNQVSEIDNRKLIEVSEIKEGNINSNIEQYVSDRIGFREKIVNIYTKGMDFFFNDMIHPSYQYGEDGYIFGKVGKEIEDKEFQEIYSDFILGFQEYCESEDIDFLYAVEPSKETVYREYLPKGYNFESENLEYFKKLLNEKNINYIYTGDALIEAKDSVQVFNKKYDAYHWNETGAIIGISAMLDRLNELDEAVEKLDVNKFEKSSHINKTLPVSYFSINEETINYNLIEDNSKPTNEFKGKIDISDKFKTFSHYINEENADAPKILVFAGSYFNGKDKFLTESFSEYTKIHSYHNVINYEYYIDIFKPDIILFESTEYTHENYYFPIDEMKKLTLK